MPVTELVVAGGLIKSAPLMQIYADVTRRPLSVIGSGQGPALGSAIHAAVAAGAYPDVPAAAAAMGREQRDVYRPDPARAAVYDELYAEYVRLHDYFGRGTNEVHAPAAGDPRPGDRWRRAREASDELRQETAEVTALRETVCALHAELVAQQPGRLDLGQRVGPGARGRADGDQAERRVLRRPDAGVHGGVRPFR